MACRVLVVDDNKDAAEILALLLSVMGYTTSVAYHGRDAIDQIDVFKPNVILLDMNMPVLDGYETARIIRGRVDSDLFHIIAITANSDPISVKKMLDAGCNATLTKPAHIDAVLSLFP